MDLIEVTQKYVILNPKVTLLMQFEYENFAFIAFERLCQSRFIILVSRAQERLWGVLVIKFILGRSEVHTAVLLIPQVIWNICCFEC